MRKIIVMAALIALTCKQSFAITGTQTVEIEKEWKGHNSGFSEPASLVIKTEGQWTEVWEKVHQPLHPRPELPVIDFENKMVVAVFMGMHSSGGYEIEIKSITRTEKELVVEVEEKEPPPESLRTMALTQPYHIVVIKKSPLPVRFQHP